MKVAAVIIVLLFFLIPMLSTIIVGDGTLQGKLQTFASYSLSLMTTLLCILTIAISTWTLSNDVQRKYILLIVTKPISRYQIVLGKILGIIVIDAILLVVFSCVIYGLTVLIPHITDAPEVQVKQAQDEFFTARAGLTQPEDEREIQRRTIEAYNKLRESGQLPQDMTGERAMAELRSQQRMLGRSVPLNSKRIWRFHNVRVTDPKEQLFVRFKYEVAVTGPDDKVHGLWDVGDIRQFEMPPGSWKTPIEQVSRSDSARKMMEIEIPASVIAEDGFVGVVFYNTLNQSTVIIQDVELLYRAGTFTGNYIRVVMLIGLRLAFLAALGVSTSTWLSFPVAFLLTMSIFLVGMISGFVIESIDSLGIVGNLVYTVSIKPLIWMFPRLDGDYNPTRFIVMGRILSWGFLAQVFGIMVCVKAGVLTLLGIWIFSNREIAKVVV